MSQQAGWVALPVDLYGTYAERGAHHNPYPPDLQEVIRQINLAYPNKAVTAGQLLVLLARYDVQEH